MAKKFSSLDTKITMSRAKDLIKPKQPNWWDSFLYNTGGAVSNRLKFPITPNLMP